MKKWTLFAAALLLTNTTWASTYYAGFEDTAGAHSDYDYNDLVFSISSDNLSLISNGNWYNKPVLGANGAPFWNNHSYDGAQLNVGYCVYGGGNCGGGLNGSAAYLAASNHGSAGDVYFHFTGGGQVEINLKFKFADDNNQLGWYSLSDKDDVHWLSRNGNSMGIFDVSPTGDFGLIGTNGLGQDFYSQDWNGTQDDASHFAFFGTDAPEPGQAGLLAIGLIGFSLLLRNKAILD